MVDLAHLAQVDNPREDYGVDEFGGLTLDIRGAPTYGNML
jgi:hypothetical protein